MADKVDSPVEADLRGQTITYPDTETSPFLDSQDTIPPKDDVEVYNSVSPSSHIPSRADLLGHPSHGRSPSFLSCPISRSSTSCGELGHITKLGEGLCTSNSCYNWV